jgi:hypothetical protein
MLRLSLTATSQNMGRSLRGGNWGSPGGVPYGDHLTTAVSDGPAARRFTRTVVAL